ncbi:MAG: hypothetical protein JOZ81_27875 [Chloroflexi bacterium]|nr:hypothetical protein [Chloroflexota bacterium]MBV9546237.1 hypothetical protein [Chloroflexota bacterium]
MTFVVSLGIVLAVSAVGVSAQDGPLPEEFVGRFQNWSKVPCSGQNDTQLSSTLGGSASDQSAGIGDDNQFLRDHLAPLPSAVPVPVTRQSAGITNVRLSRVREETLKTGVRVHAAAG